MKRFLVLTILFYAVFMTFISYRVSKAYFASMAVSSTNTFVAAAQFPTGTPTPTPTGTITPTPPQNIANHVVISEVQIDGGNGQLNDNDFVELYNPTGSDISLNGMRLVMRPGNSTNESNIFIFTNGNTIKSHGFFLWAHKSSNNSYADSVNADASSAATLGASNSVAVRQGALGTGTIIDALSWDAAASSLKEGAQFGSTPGVNQSIERKALSTSTASTMAIGGADEFKGNGFDTENNATDFVLRTVSQPQNSSSPTEAP